MVQLGSASVAVVVDSSIVEHEVVLDFDGDGNDGLVEGGHESVHIDGVDLGEGVEAVPGSLGGGLARSLGSSVGVGVLGGDLVVDDVLVGEGHESSVAAVVSVGSGAVDQLLLGEGHEAVVLQEVRGLQRGDGREGPARSALSLVLDGSDGSSDGSPVDVSGGGEAGGQGLVVLVLLGLHQVLVLELVEGHVGELVHGQRVSLGVVGVGSADQVHVALEDRESVLELVFGSIGLVVLGLEVHELLSHVRVG